MSWEALILLIADEVGKDAASRIEDRARHELGGQRITIRKTKIVNTKVIDSVAAGKPKEAAQKLGVHISTVYRALNKPFIR